MANITRHGLEIIQGPDIARIIIPDESNRNAQKLDGAAGHFIVSGTPESTYISQGAVWDGSQWNAETDANTARLIQLTAGAVNFYIWQGSEGQQNITWTGQATLDSAGNLTVNQLNTTSGTIFSNLIISNQYRTNPEGITDWPEGFSFLLNGMKIAWFQTVQNLPSGQFAVNFGPISGLVINTVLFAIGWCSSNLVTTTGFGILPGNIWYCEFGNPGPAASNQAFASMLICI